MKTGKRFLHTKICHTKFSEFKRNVFFLQEVWSVVVNLFNSKTGLKLVWRDGKEDLFAPSWEMQRGYKLHVASTLTENKNLKKKENLPARTYSPKINNYFWGPKSEEEEEVEFLYYADLGKLDLDVSCTQLTPLMDLKGEKRKENRASNFNGEGGKNGYMFRIALGRVRGSTPSNDCFSNSDPLKRNWQTPWKLTPLQQNPTSNNKRADFSGKVAFQTCFIPGVSPLTPTI